MTAMRFREVPLLLAVDGDTSRVAAAASGAGRHRTPDDGYELKRPSVNPTTISLPMGVCHSGASSAPASAVVRAAFGAVVRSLGGRCVANADATQSVPAEVRFWQPVNPSSHHLEDGDRLLRVHVTHVPRAAGRPPWFILPAAGRGDPDQPSRRVR